VNKELPSVGIRIVGEALRDGAQRSRPGASRPEVRPDGSGRPTGAKLPTAKRRDHAEIHGNVKSKPISRGSLVHFPVNTAKDVELNGYETTTNKRYRANDNGCEVDMRERRADTKMPRRDESSRVAASMTVIELHVKSSRDSETELIKRERERHVYRACTIFHYRYIYHYHTLNAPRAYIPSYFNRRSINATRADTFLFNRF